MACFPHFDILAKTRSRVTTATTFSRQNDAGSRTCTTYYWENLVLVIVLVLESKGLLCPIILHLRCFTSLLIGFLSALQYWHASVGFFLDTCYETSPSTIPHVSHPYSRTATTSVLLSLSFFLLRIFFGRQILFNLTNTLLAFDSLFFRSFFFRSFIPPLSFFQVFQVFSGLSFSGLSYHLPPFSGLLGFFRSFFFRSFIQPPSFFRSFSFSQVFLFQVFPFQVFHTTSLLFQVFQVSSGLSFSGLSDFLRSFFFRSFFFRSFIPPLSFFQVFQVFSILSFSGLSFTGLSYHLPPFFRSFRFFQVFLFQVFHTTSLHLSLLKQTVSELIHFCYSLSSYDNLFLVLCINSNHLCLLHVDF